MPPRSSRLRAWATRGPLGDAVTIGSLRLYSPWAWLGWTADFGPYAPAIFRTVKIIGWTVFLVPWLPLVGALLYIARRRPTSTAHGSAAWGTDADLLKSGMLTGEGVVLCQTNVASFRPLSKQGAYEMVRPGRLITHGGPEHVMVFAPTRSGKGIGTVIPTLLN